jgi:nitrogen regulatory protein P-II 1
MKKIEAIVRPEKAADVIKALDEIGHPGMMISEIEGYGRQHGKDDKVMGKKYHIDLITKTRIEIIVKDNDVKKISSAIREASFTGGIGDGKIFIYPVDDAVRLRTNEKGEDAIY